MDVRRVVIGVDERGADGGDRSGEVCLRPGDWLVCNGVVHDWRNDLDEASVMIGVIYGANG